MDSYEMPPRSEGFARGTQFIIALLLEVDSLHGC